MNTYTEGINKLRAQIDFEINKRKVLDLASPELVKKALMIEQQLASKN